MSTTALQAVAVVAVLLTTTPPAAAQLSPSTRPAGGQVVAGQASIAQAPNKTTVTQSSQNAAVNWQSYDVGSAHTVEYIDPSSKSITLNRVVGPNPSEVAGRIVSNGTVMIVNQAGLLFDRGAQVNTAGLVVSAAGISNSNFMAGRMIFDQAAKPGAKIENRGTITIKDEGLAALVAPQVANSGVIRARLGKVILAGAEAETLDLYGDGMVSINVTKQVHKASDGTRALVTNSGVISADGGSVLLTAQAVDGVVQTLVDAGGNISANSVAGHSGRVVIAGRGGDVVVTGAIAVNGSAAGTTGGSVAVHTTGTVALASSARITASGKAGGGTIAIGTTLKRAAGGQSVTGQPIAKAVLIAPGAKLAADGTAKGNGGRVTVLSTSQTTMGGTITAKGGRNGGDGGFVEVSGKQGYALTGTIDVSAPRGNLGTILLDPDFLTIVAGATADANTLDPAFNAGSGGTVAASAAPAVAGMDTVSNGVIDAFTGNVLLQANQTLTVAAPISLTQPGQTLTLEAGGTITVNAGIVASAPGDAILATGGAGPGVVPVAQATPLIQVLGTIASTGGSVSLLSGATGTVAIGATGSVSASSGQRITVQTDTLAVASGGSLTAASGLIELAPASAIAVNLGGGTGLAVSQAALTAMQTDVLRVGAATINGTLTQTASAITVGGAINLSGIATMLDLQTSGAVTQSAALTNVGTLTGAVSSATLTALGNLVGTLGAFTSTAGLALANAGPLTVNGPVSDTGATSTLALTTTTGGLTLAGNVAATNVLSLISAGGISQTGGSISAGTLSVATNGPGDVRLTTSTNRIAASNGISVNAGALALVDNETLLLTGAYSAQQLFFEVNAPGAALQLGSSTSGATLTSGSGQSISLVADAITEGSAASAIAAPSGTVGLAPFSGGRDVSLAGASGAHLLIDGTLLGDINTGQLVIGRFTDVPNGGTSTVTAGNILLDGSVNLTGIASALGLFGSGGVTEPAGALTTSTLFGSAGSISLLNSANLITTLGGGSGQNLMATGGDLSIANGGQLNVSGTVSASGNVYLQTPALQGVDFAASSTVIAGNRASFQTDVFNQSGFGAVMASTFELAPSTAGGTITLGGAGSMLASLNGIQAGTVRVGAVTVPGSGFTVTAGSISVGGNFGTSLVNLELDSQGAISQSGGAVLTAATLAGSAGGDVGLTSVNAIGGLGSFNVTGGSFSLNDSGLTGNLTMSGPVTAASVTITGATTLTATGFIQATDSAGAVSLTSGSGGISLGSGAIVTGATFVVDAGGGAITESGAINAGTLTGSAGTTASFTGNNTIATLGSFTAPDGFALNNGEVLAIAGPVSSNSGTVVVSNGTFGLSLPGTISALAATLAAGSIGIGGTLAVTGSASLVSGGAITEGGTIQAATLSGSAGTTASFTGSNTIATLGAFSAPNGFTLLDKKLLSIAGLVTTNSGTVVIDTGTFGLTLPGRISAAAATLSAGSIAIDGTLAVTDTASFIASGSITESGAISAGTLAGSAGTTATLTGANTIATLSSFSAPDGFTLNNGEVLSIAGPVSSSGTVVVSNGSFGLTVPGTISALAATLSASSIGIAGALAVTDTASLVSGGGITESGVINAGTLTGSAGATASFTGNNTIGTLVNFGVTGGTNAFDLTDATPLIVAGTVTGAGNVYLRDTGVGGITIASSGSVGAGTTQFAGFQTDLFTINAGGKVTGGTFELAPNTPGRSLTLGTGGAGLALSSLSGIGPAALRLGAVTLPGDLSPTITARSIVVAGAFGGGAISVELDSLGGISQTSGVLTAGILTGHAAGGVSLGSANAVGNLDSFNVSGGSSFTLVDSGLAGGLGVSGVVTAANVTIEGAPTVTVTGTIAAAGTLILSSGAGGIQLDAGDFLSAGLVDLSTTGGGVHQAAGGTIAAGVLTSTGDIAGAAILQGTSNQIGTISGLTAVGTLTVVDSEALVLAGIVSAGSTGTVDIGTTGGGLTQGAAGTLIAGTLTGTGGIAGEAILQGTANQIGSIVGLTANGTLTVVDDKALVLAGLVSAGSIGTIDISTTNGGLTQGLSGTLVAGSLVSTGGIAGAAILQGSANQIGAIGGLTAAGALAVVDNQALTLAGLVSAGSTGTVDIHTMNGGLTQGPSGTLVAGVLTSTNGIGGAAILQGTANQIGTIGGLTAIGELTVVNQQALALAGLISVGPAGVADIHTINGGLTEGPAGTLIAGVLTSTNGIGGAAILQGTSNQIGTISRLTAVGGLTVVDNQALTLAGLVSAGTTGTIDVHTVDGGLMQGAAGTLITGTLTSTGGIGGAAILQGAANQIGTITELTVAGSLTAVDNEALILAGLVSAGATGTVDIHTAIGGVTQGPSGTLIADTLTSTGGIGGAAILQGTANLVGTISGVTAIGALTVVDNEALALAEVVSAGTAGTVDIHTTNGGVTEGPDGALMTGVLTSTGGIEGAAVLQGTANQIGTIAGLTAVGALTVVDNEALALAGLVSAGSAGVVDIHTTGGGLTQGASGTLVTGTLTSTGGIAGGATLLGTGNQIATISDLTAVGNLTVVDTQALGLAGLVSAGSTGLADISTTAGGVTQSSTGTLIAGTLLSSGGITGSVSLQGTNLIANLGSAAATPGALRATEDIVVDDATDLTIAGDVVAGSGTPASSTASLTIASTGAMTVNGQAAAASVAGNVTLIAGNLFIASAGGVQPAIEAAGAVTMVSAGVLSQTGGAVGAGSVALFALNGATLSNGAIVATTGSVGITAPLTTVGSNETIAAVNTATGVVFSGSVNQSAASYIGSNGSVSVGSMLTESGGALLAVGDVALGSLSQSGGTIAAGGALTIGSGSFMAGWIGSSATIGSFNQSGGLLAAAGAGNIFTTGVFAQTAGVLATGGTLGVTANLGITIGGTVSAAGPSSGFMLLASGGDAVLGISGLLAGAALDVPGDMIPGNALQAPSGTVQVAGPSGTQAFARAAPVGKIAAVTGYQVTPPAGLPVVPVFATPLVGVPDTSTPTPAQFRGAAIDIERPVTASTLGLYAAASIVEGPSAVINAARLTGSSGSDVNFLAPGNTVGTLGTFDDTGHGFHLVDASNLMLTGLLSANSVQITDMNFTIDLAGAIAANSVLVQAADIALTTGSSFSGLGAGSATPLKADPFPLPGSPGIYLNAANISVAANPPLATGYTVNWTFALTGSGNVALGNFQQPRVKLFLNLASGTATGQVDVAGLQVLYDAAAPAMTTIDLTGVVGGISGQATAGDSHIASKPNNKYQINGCPISSLNCIRFTGLTVPVTNPLQDVDVGNVDQLYDTDSVLPDVAERDY